MLSPHETFTKATHLILFLCTEDWLSRFYAARSNPEKLRSSTSFPVCPQQRTFVSAIGTSVSATSACEQSQQGNLYSINSSARASSVRGMIKPRALAALRLMTSSNLVACSIGRSAGLAPLRILSTKVAARRYIGMKSTP